jgi:hypothetical protein
MPASGQAVTLEDHRDELLAMARRGDELADSWQTRMDKGRVELGDPIERDSSS